MKPNSISYRRSTTAAFAATFILIGCVGGCGDAYECSSQSVGGDPSPSCDNGGDIFSCPMDTCEVSFSGCDDGAPRLLCAGSTCTCFDGDEEIGSCDYAPDQCPTGLHIELSGDDTEAMTFFEDCCGVGVGISTQSSMPRNRSAR
jgi:hypothetical protein